MIQEAFTNPYHILQIEESATTEQIRERYLLLSKTFHPDKQPFENYDLAKKYFLKIDEAYKSVSTPLRKYIYSQFAMEGITILEQYTEEFVQYESTIHLESSQQAVEELIFYFYMLEDGDPDEQLTKTQIIGYVELSGMFDPKRHPEISPKLVSDKVIFASTVPELAEFQNTVEMDVELTHQRENRTTFKVYSSRRFWKGILSGIIVSNDMMIWQGGVSDQVVFSVNISPSTTLTFTPIILENTSLSTPKIGFQRVFANDMSVMAETNFSNLNLEINQTKDGLMKFINLDFELNMLESSFGLEKTISEDCQLVCGCTLTAVANPGSTDLTLGEYYGIKLSFGPETKVEIRSMIGLHNFLDIRINKGKHFIRMPFFVGATTMTWEISKFSIILLGYMTQRLYKIKHRQQKNRRIRLLKRGFSHLTDNRSRINKLIEENREQSRMSRASELLLNGLVIIKGLYGNQTQIRGLMKKYRKQKINKAVPLFEEFERLSLIDNDVFTTHEEEIYDITEYIQGNVIGARLKNFKPLFPNPCIDESDRPVLLIWYIHRGNLSLIKSALKEPINIGLAPKKVNNPLSRMMAWFRVNFV